MYRYPNEYQDVLVSIWQEARDGRLDKLGPAECLEQYGKTIQSDRQNLLLVAGDSNFSPRQNNSFINGSMVYWAGSFTAGDMANTLQEASESYSWICSGLPESEEACADRIQQIKSTPQTWRVDDSLWPVEYCLSQKAEPRCKLQFIPIVLIVVTVLNFSKCTSCISEYELLM